MLQDKQKDIELNSTMDTMAAMYGDEKIETSLGYLDDLNNKYKDALSTKDGEDSLSAYKEALNDPKLLEQKEQLTGKE